MADNTSNTTMTDMVDITNTKNRYLQWQQECVSLTAAAAATNDTKDDQTKHRRKLYKEASRFFASIVVSDGRDTSHEQALALLIQSLQPAFLGYQNHNKDSDGSSNNSGNTSQTTQHRIHAHLAALACLQGALRACRDRRVGRLSPGLIDLVGNFLLPQIGPLDLNKNRSTEMDLDNVDNDVDGDLDVDIDALEQEVRDSSLETMKLLLQTTTTSQTTASSAPSTTTGIKAWNTMISLTCRLAQSAVQRRCAEGDYGDDQGYNQLNDRQSLSLLPRSKRSACFDVLRAAVDSLNHILSCSNATIVESQQQHREDDDNDTLHNFALFCIASLVGESDPRCLLQLLQLLSALQEAYAFATTARKGSIKTKAISSIDDGSSSFPVVPLFNAVAPYYPIQFTPPPNNIHGITKQALQTALWSVLSCTKNDHHHHHDHRRHDTDHHPSSTMFSLTLGIVLERLVPPDPDDPPSTPEEQLEALEDLTNLLQLSSNDDKDTATTRRGASSSSSSRLDWMDTTAMKQLSETLRTVHDRASLVVAKEAARGGEGAAATSSFAARVNKQVADMCRTLVGRIAIALECETTNCTKSNRQRQQRWQAFVADLVQNQLAPKLLLLGDYGSRAAIAYMACLAGCGGIKTLRLVLQCGLHPLINVVVANYSSTTPLEQDEQANKNEKDDASIAIAISGIAAFLVSTHVTLSKMQQQGIVLTPHPLHPHATRMLNVFSKIILSDNHANNDIRIAAVRAVEAVLLTVPAQVLFGQTSDMNDAVQSNSGQTTIMETIVQLFQVMTDAVVVSVHAAGQTTPDDEENTWSKACAETLGRVLGKVLEENPQVSHDDDDEDSGGLSTDVYVGILQDNHTIRGFLLDSVLTALLSSASVPTTTKGISNRYRYDRMTLAMSAGSRSSAAARILQPLLQELLTLVQNQERETEPSVFRQATTCAQTVSFILSNGGGTAAAMAFQQDSMTSMLLDVIKALANQAAISMEEGGMESMFRMSKLKLPPTEEDENLMFELVERGRDLLLPLLSGYSFATIAGHRERLGQAVANVLPPLNNSDTVRLSLTLPFLATALQQDDSSTRLQETENATLSAIITDLADFALYGNGSSAPSRSFAAVCLHAILVRMDASMTTCPCFELMKTVVIPLLQQVIKSSSSTGRKDFPDLIVKCKEALSFAGLLGSAAACRGGSSAKTADKIVCLLIDLACRRTATETFSKANGTPTTIDLTLFDKNQKGSSTDLGIGAASAFGSILSCGGSDSLWKQRMCVIGYNQLHDNMVDDMSKPSIGAVCVSSYLICSTSSLSSLPSKNGSSTELLTKIILNSLSPPAGADATTASPQCILPTMVKKLVLTAIIKLLCVSPASVTPNLYFIVVGVMRAYASNVPDGPYSSLSAAGQDDTVCKVLALQALETIATVPGAPKDLLGAVKPAVVAILGAAMNEKSSVLRQAAVEVRNAWFVISTASTTGNGAYSFGTTALAGAAEAV